MTVLGDGQGLLQAIIDDPADDLSRLAYADWLEEGGQAQRAEFIRCQIAYAALRPVCRCEGYVCRCEGHGEPCRACRLHLRQCVLLHGLGVLGQELPAGAIACLGPPPAADHLACRAARGFVEQVRCDLTHWREHGPAIVRAHPVGRVELTDKEPCDVGAGRFAWAIDDGEDAPPWRLPDWLATAFDRPAPLGFVWPGREPAVLACSRGLINWAKGQPHGA